MALISLNTLIDWPEYMYCTVGTNQPVIVRHSAPAASATAAAAAAAAVSRRLSLNMDANTGSEPAPAPVAAVSTSAISGSGYGHHANDGERKLRSRSIRDLQQTAGTGRPAASSGEQSSIDECTNRRANRRPNSLLQTPHVVVAWEPELEIAMEDYYGAQRCEGQSPPPNHVLVIDMAQEGASVHVRRAELQALQAKRTRSKAAKVRTVLNSSSMFGRTYVCTGMYVCSSARLRVIAWKR